MENNYNILTQTQGTSMLPLINSESELIINTQPNQKLAVGNIPCFLEKRGLVAHRIIQKQTWNKKSTWLLKGDNNNHNDGYFLSKDLCGKTEYILNDSQIIDLSKFQVIHNLISWASLHSESKKYYSHFFKRMIHFLAIIVNLLNLNTGNNELKLISDFKNNKKGVIVSNSLLYFLSLKNKNINLLSRQKNKIFQDFFIEVLNTEKSRTLELLKQNKINVFSLNNPKNENNIEGSDIDIIISYKDLKKTLVLFQKNGYSIFGIPPQEIMLKNKINNIEIDLHFLTNVPRNLFFNKIQTLKLTKSYLKCFSQPNSKYKNEYFLFREIVSFWTNDFLKGIYTLYKIGNFASQHKICPKRLNIISKKHDFFKETQFILKMYKVTFKDDSVNHLITDNSFIEKTLLNYFTLKKVGVFGSIRYWWDEGNRYTNKINREIHIISLLLNENISFFRKLRIRVFLLLSKVLILYLFNGKIFFPRK